MLLRDNSQITATAQGNGNGGNININAPILVGLENSDIIANAVKGKGGNITITTQGIIGLEFRNTLTPRVDFTNDITASSKFSVNGTVQINNIGVDPNSGLVELPALGLISVISLHIEKMAQLQHKYQNFQKFLCKRLLGIATPKEKLS